MSSQLSAKPSVADDECNLVDSAGNPFDPRRRRRPGTESAPSAGEPAENQLVSLSVTMSIVPVLPDRASPTQNCHVPAAVSPLKVVRLPAAAAPLFGAWAHMNLPEQAFAVSPTFAPRFSALVAAPASNTTGTALLRFELSP